MLLHQIVKRGPAYPEQLCCLRKVGADLRESYLKCLALSASSRITNGERLGFLPDCRKTQIDGRQQGTIGHDDSAFDAVFELAHVSWPWVISERGERSGAEAARRSAVLRSEPREKKTRQYHRVGGSLPERRHLHSDLI